MDSKLKWVITFIGIYVIMIFISWFESNIPNSLNDSKTKNLIDYSGANNLGTVISLDRFTGGSISDPGSTYAANEFKYILSKGKEEKNYLPDRI